MHRSRRALLLGLAVVAACSPGPSEQPLPVRQSATAQGKSPASPPAASISEAQVLGATVTGIFATPATFVDGAHEGAPFVPGGAARPIAVMMTPVIRFGDLDTMPGADAAVLIASNEGGSGERISLAIVGLRNGAATSVATTLVGDRTKIRDVRVDGPDMVLDVVEIGPGQAACCGTQLATKTYRLEGATVVLRSSQVTGTLSLANTVTGHTWTAVSIDGEPLAAGVTAPTLSVADAAISGSSGCNQYRGPIAEPTPGTVRIGPTSGTRRACTGPAGEAEARFLQALSAATRYSFLAGRLVLSGLDGDQMRTLTFGR